MSDMADNPRFIEIVSRIVSARDTFGCIQRDLFEYRSIPKGDNLIWLVTEGNRLHHEIEALERDLERLKRGEEPWETQT